MRCVAAYSTEVLDQGSWFPGWDISRNTTVGEQNSHPTLEQAYIFRTEAALNGKPFWGKLTTYTGGGFVAILGNKLQVRIIIDYYIIYLSNFDTCINNRVYKFSKE